jgi:hypothetical protein
MCPCVHLGRVRVLRHSIGNVQLMKFILPPGATAEEVAEVFRRASDHCIEHGLRGAFILDDDRPAATDAEVKSAVSALNLEAVPENFRVAVVAFRKPTYTAYRYGLATLKNGGAHTKLFWDELDALAWLRGQFAG